MDRGVILRLLLLVLLVTAASAHQIDEIEMRIERQDDRFVITAKLDAAYMLPEYRGDAEIAPFDLAWLRGRTTDEWLRIRTESEHYLRECLQLDGPEVVVRFPDFEREPPRFVDEGMAEMLPMIDATLEGETPATGLDLGWREPFGVVLILREGEETYPLVPGERITLFAPDGGSPPSFSRWIVLGFRHILPDGLDHILFILGIFLLLPKWRPLLAESLVFTLAHSLTLACAALGWIAVPAALVEIAIGASIAWIGVENLLLGQVERPGRRRYLVIALFGLVHGLGFARMLSPYLPADQPARLVTGLFGFNLGVELGQLTVLAIAFALCGWWKGKPLRWLQLVGSAGIALAGAFWVIERGF